MIRSIAAVLGASCLPLALAFAADNVTGIPQLESLTAGWSKVADDFQPPPSGPGPVTYDKDHPYVPNNDKGRQVTFRIADLTNPILRPWAIEKQLHVVERFQVTEGGMTLQVTIRVEDPGAFNMPWFARQTYHRTRTGAMEETICAENNIAFDASVSEIPKAEKPDF
jgi:hypothetical protein